MAVRVWRGGGLGSGPAVFCAIGKQRTRQAVVRAWREGASLILVDRAFSRNVPCIVPRARLRTVHDVRRAYARLAALEFGNPSRSVHVVGVTGTNGKSTVTSLLHWVLNETGRPAGIIGTVRVSTGRREEPGGLTTPDAYDIARYLAEMRDSGFRYAVMEASSHGLDQRRTDGVVFKTGIFTNLSEDHLDYHRSVTSYARAKRRLFEQIPPHGTAILNADDPMAAFMGKGIRAPILWYGTSTGVDVEGHWRGSLAEVTAPGFHTLGPLAGLGHHRLLNALAALAAAIVIGVPGVCAWEAISRYPGLWRRLELVEGPEPVTVIDDCAHNPENIRAALTAARPLTRTGATLHVLYAVRGSRGVAVNRMNAAALAEELGNESRFWLTNARDLAGPDDAVQWDEEEAYHTELQQRSLSYRHTATAEEAMQEIQQTMQPGDVVLLLGAHAIDRAATVWRRLRALSQVSPARPRCPASIPV